jgi:hypothetical protein
MFRRTWPSPVGVFFDSHNHIIVYNNANDLYLLVLQMIHGVILLLFEEIEEVASASLPRAFQAFLFTPCWKVNPGSRLFSSPSGHRTAKNSIKGGHQWQL